MEYHATATRQQFALDSLVPARNYPIIHSEHCDSWLKPSLSALVRGCSSRGWSGELTISLCTGLEHSTRLAVGQRRCA